MDEAYSLQLEEAMPTARDIIRFLCVSSPRSKGIYPILMKGQDLNSFETVIPLGDFQPANVLIPNDRSLGAVYLIDWVQLEGVGGTMRWFCSSCSFAQGSGFSCESVVVR